MATGNNSSQKDIMKRLPLLFVIILAAACWGNRHGHEIRALDKAYQMLNNHPDSTLAILEAIPGQFLLFYSFQTYDV